MSAFDLMPNTTTPGPKRKTLATEHLEYIIHAMLDSEKQDVVFEMSPNNESVVTVNGRKFNLTKIMAAEPQFEFISLSENQLNTYLDQLSSYDKYRRFDTNQHLHPAEKIALHKYTTRDFDLMNKVLRGGKQDQLESMLLDVCVAAQALHKHPGSSLSDTPTLYRGDSTYDHVTSQSAPENKGNVTTTNRGFFSSSKKRSVAQKFTEDRGVVTEIYSNPHAEPAKLEVSGFSEVSKEQETLFAPNTLFEYRQIEPKKWAARPIYRVDVPEKKYEHSFLDSELAAIGREHLQLKIKDKPKSITNELLHFLQEAKAANSHGKLRRLVDTVKNKEKIGCLDRVIKKIDELKKKPVPDQQDVLEVIAQIKKSIGENKALGGNVSGGKTHRALTAALGMAQQVYNDLDALINEQKPSEPTLAPPLRQFR